MLSIKQCNLCPRNCNVDRSSKIGYCKSKDKIKIARAGLHFWEEPCISTENGSGAVFFSGCNLRCCFCQNYNISSENFGKEISVNRLAEIFVELKEKNADNINLVTPTQFVPLIIEALEIAKPKIKNLPIIYNCGGYENIETINSLKDYVDVFLPDLKYYSSELSEKYSNAPDYFKVASKAIEKMFQTVGEIKFDENGKILKGVIIRHLVLPGAYRDSIKLVEWIYNTFGNDKKVLLSLMNQYTPMYKVSEHKELNRRLTTMEYKKVLNRAVDLGIDGYMQDKSSQKTTYTPDFNLDGV